MDDTSTLETSAQTDEARSKDEFFRRLAVIGEDMIAAHGKDFAIGALVLLARFLVEGKERSKPSEPTIGEWMKGATPLGRAGSSNAAAKRDGDRQG